MPDAPNLMASESRDVPGDAAGRPTAKRRSWMWRTIRGLLVVYLLIVLAAMFLEDSLIYFPMRYPAGDWDQKSLPFEDAWFRSADGTQLHGWYVPHKAPRAVVLFCHGNAGNLSHRLPILEVLHERVGVSTLIFDYRGYGRSAGKPSEAGILADARAARRWLADREKIAEAEIVVLGESLGGAVAVDLAASDGALRVGAGEHLQQPDRRGRLPLSLVAGSLGDANPPGLGGEDCRLSRSAVAGAWRRRHDCATLFRPAASRRRQSAEEAHHLSGPRSQRSDAAGVLR